MNCYIRGTQYYIPQRIVDNDFFVEHCGIERDFLGNKIGIKERRFASEDENTSDMAAKAALKLIEENLINKEDIDLLIVCTQNPDYRLPTTACIAQNKIGLKTSTMAFDINLGCSGFTYSLPVASSLIKSGMVNNAIIIMADQYTKILDYKDRATGGLFGDAAAASLIQMDDVEGGVIDSNFGTDGSGYDLLILHNSGVAVDKDKGNKLYMNGREIYKFVLKKIPMSIDELLTRNDLKKSDIKHFIFHQANAYMLARLAEKMELNRDQWVLDFEKIGNTISATIPIAFKNMEDKGLLKKGDMIVFSGFGVGLSWANVLYKYV